MEITETIRPFNFAQEANKFQTAKNIATIKHIKWIEIHPELFKTIYPNVTTKLPYVTTGMNPAFHVCPWGCAEKIEQEFNLPMYQRVMDGLEGKIEGTHGGNVQEMNLSMITTETME